MVVDKEIEMFKQVQEADTNRHEKAIVYKNTQEGDGNSMKRELHRKLEGRFGQHQAAPVACWRGDAVGEVRRPAHLFGLMASLPLGVLHVGPRGQLPGKKQQEKAVIRAWALGAGRP